MTKAKSDHSAFLLIIAVFIIFVIILTLFGYFSSASSTNIFCGGITGRACPKGYYCKYEGNFPDAGGYCNKTPFFFNRTPSPIPTMKATPTNLPLSTLPSSTIKTFSWETSVAGETDSFQFEYPSTWIDKNNNEEWLNSSDRWHQWSTGFDNPYEKTDMDDYLQGKIYIRILDNNPKTLQLFDKLKTESDRKDIIIAGSKGVRRTRFDDGRYFEQVILPLGKNKIVDINRHIYDDRDTRDFIQVNEDTLKVFEQILSSFKSEVKTYSMRSLIENWSNYQEIADINEKKVGTDSCGVNDNKEFAQIREKTKTGYYKILKIDKATLAITPNYFNWSNKKFLSFKKDETALCGVGGVYPLHAFTDKLLWISYGCGGVYYPGIEDCDKTASAIDQLY
jgi:hypothetical protein